MPATESTPLKSYVYPAPLIISVIGGGLCGAVFLVDSMRGGIIVVFGVVVGLCFVVCGLFIRRASVPLPREI